jgi:response regulator RpfG family c-di-GMP phosphodiesterase
MKVGESTTVFHGTARAPEYGFLQEWLGDSLILSEDWSALSLRDQAELVAIANPEEILRALIEKGLLTGYQADRIAARRTFGLVLGNYRVLDRLGAGGMGVVFLAEHIRLRSLVAIKVLPLSSDHDSRLLHRFFAEMRAVAHLKHPNIVGAMDAGEVEGRDGEPALHYFVMEYVPGQDLDEAVRQHGPFAPPKACDVISQIAAALGEAHKFQLVHRDIKPSNIRMTTAGHAKLLDFGLVRGVSGRMTEPGAVLGTLEYLAPEQALDASAVDIRADIFSLGGTLFWCLTGTHPFPSSGRMTQDLLARLDQDPPSARKIRPSLPADVDRIIARMMARDPNDRYDSPEAVKDALRAFLHEPAVLARPGTSLSKLASLGEERPATHKVLLVDDSPTSRAYCSAILKEEGIACDEAASAEEAWTLVQQQPYDLVVTDWVMPGMDGLELCRQLREHSPWPNLQIMVFSAALDDDQVAQALAAGANDYLVQKASPVQLRARVAAALRAKAAHDRTDRLFQQLLQTNTELENALATRDGDLVQIRSALVMGLTSLVESRHVERGAHALRMQRYCRRLATEAAHIPALTGQIDGSFIDMLEASVPLHDIGKIALPEHILSKPGKYDTDERILMQGHALIGAEMLQKVAQRYGPAVAFLGMAIEIARYHHEHFDGSGYPDGLKGQDIPLAARMVTICDRYDALRSRRTYRPGHSHTAAMQVMTNSNKLGHFDADLFQAFLRCAPEFDVIYRTSDGAEM